MKKWILRAQVPSGFTPKRPERPFLVQFPGLFNIARGLSAGTTKLVVATCSDSEAVFELPKFLVWLNIVIYYAQLPIEAKHEKGELRSSF